MYMSLKIHILLKFTYFRFTLLSNEGDVYMCSVVSISL